MQAVESPHVVHIITSLGDGGAEAVLYRLCISDKLFTHSVISLTDLGKYGPLLVDKGIQVYSLDMVQGRISVKGLWLAWRLIRDIQPALVHTWMYHADLIGGVVARMAGIRSIFWNIRHSNLEPGKVSRSTILVARCCAFLSRWIPDRIVCCAYEAAEAHRRLGYDASKIVVINNGYDLQRFKPVPEQGIGLRLSLGLERDIPLLGCVARYNPEKDHVNLMAALHLVMESELDFNCILIGSNMSPHNAEIVSLVDRYGLAERVHLLGARDDVPALMNAMDIHVLSSSSEGFPNVLAEAMACGTPCVTTDVGDAAAIVRDYGWVVPSKSSKILAEAIISAIEARCDVKSWVKRKESCRYHVVLNYSLESMVESYRQVWISAGN